MPEFGGLGKTAWSLPKELQNILDTFQAALKFG